MINTSCLKESCLLLKLVSEFQQYFLQGKGSLSHFIFTSVTLTEHFIFCSFRCSEHAQTVGTLINPHVGGCGGVGMMIDVTPPPSSTPSTMTTTCTSTTAPSACGLDVIHGTRPPHTYESPFT